MHQKVRIHSEQLQIQHKISQEKHLFFHIVTMKVNLSQCVITDCIPSTQNTRLCIQDHCEVLPGLPQDYGLCDHQDAAQRAKRKQVVGAMSGP
jgi:hypothetical protein